MALEPVHIPCVAEANALAAATDPNCTRNVMAGLYADCIRAGRALAKSQGGGVDFGAINRAILARWPKGLEYIKRRAWKILEGGRS